MNRPGTVPQSLRGIPAGFGAQQQAQQPGRAVSNRLPNGKLGSNAPSWAFGAGMPMGGGGLQNPARQLGGGGGGGNVSFAQSLSGSQPATPLDLSEFPSLANTSQISSSNQSSMWSTTSSRNIGAPVQRSQGTPIPSQQIQQDDLFTAPPRLSTQGSFRFGNQGSIGQSSQAQTASTADDFPPLNRNGTGEIGQDRGSSLMSSLAFTSQGSGAIGAAQSSRAGNGLLNALSANARFTEARSPTSGSRVQESRSSAAEDETRQKSTAFREDSIASQTSPSESVPMASENRNPLGAIGNEAPNNKAAADKESRTPPDVQDPLAGMAPIDKFGLKGLRTLMNNYADYNALICGIDPSTLGLDLSSSESISSQVYSLFDDVPPRPSIPKFRLPDCYHVTNVQPIEDKIQSFNEETLMWIFYSCPGDIKQQLAAIELNNRNWRWHKKLQIWLTKDDLMTPQALSPNHERGYYVIWDTASWRKERREFTLHYADLDTNPGGGAA